MKRTIFLFSLASLFLGGCRSSAPIFRIQEENTVILPADGRHRPKLAILPFADNRGCFRENRIGLGYIPFFPLGWSKFNRIEERYPNYFRVSASDDITWATAACFTNSGLFQEVTLATGKEVIGDAEYVLSGSIENMRYSRIHFTYGNSVLAPINASIQRLDLRLILRDRNGNVVWKWKPELRDQMHVCVQGAYYCK